MDGAAGILDEIYCRLGLISRLSHLGMTALRETQHQISGRLDHQSILMSGPLRREEEEKKKKINCRYCRTAPLSPLKIAGPGETRFSLPYGIRDTV